MKCCDGFFMGIVSPIETCSSHLSETCFGGLVAINELLVSLLPLTRSRPMGTNPTLELRILTIRSHPKRAALLSKGSP